MKVLEIIALSEADPKKAAGIGDKLANWAFRKITGAGTDAAAAEFIKAKNKAVEALVKEMNAKAAVEKPTNKIIGKDAHELTKDEVDNIVGEVFGDLVRLPDNQYVKKGSPEHLVPVNFVVQVPTNTRRKARKPGDPLAPPSTETKTETRWVPWTQAPADVQEKIRQEMAASSWITKNPAEYEKVKKQALVQAEEQYAEETLAITTGEANRRFDKIKDKALVTKSFRDFVGQWGFDTYVLWNCFWPPYSRFQDKLEQLQNDLNQNKANGKTVEKEIAEKYYLKAYEAEKKVLVAEVIQLLLVQFATKIPASEKGQFSVNPLNGSTWTTITHLFLPFLRLAEADTKQKTNWIITAINNPITRVALISLVNWEQVSIGLGAAMVNYVLFPIPMPPGIPNIEIKPGDWVTASISNMIPELDSKAKELIAKAEADKKKKNSENPAPQPVQQPVPVPQPNNTPPTTDIQSGSRADRLSGFN